MRGETREDDDWEKRITRDRGEDKAVDDGDDSALLKWGCSMMSGKDKGIRRNRVICRMLDPVRPIRSGQ